MAAREGRTPGGRGYGTERVVGGDAARYGAQPGIIAWLLGLVGAWLMVGFTLGTLLLRGPVGWLVTHSRAADWGVGRESLAMLMVISAYVLGSAFLAYAIETWRRRAPAHLRVAAPLILVGLTTWTAWTWIHPPPADVVTITSDADGRFAYGPYPTRETIVHLKQQGFTGLISLLHPAVIPFEPKLLADERRLASELDLELVEAPMLPWVSGNAASAETIRNVVARGKGRFYIHCYLGRDRIRRARAVVEQAMEDYSLSGRLARSRGFERGAVVELDDDVYLSPYPTESEMTTYVLGGSVATVLSLLDPEREQHLTWVEQERAALDGSGIVLQHSPIREAPFDPETALAAARTARSLRRPLLVHAFLTESTAAQAFAQAYSSELPPLPPMLFREQLRNGAMTVVAPNIAFGPRPVTREFGRLFVKGVRVVVHVGTAPTASLAEDRRLAAEAGLEWYDRSGEIGALLAALGRGGPWYLYGTAAEEIAGEAASAYGPAMPERFARGVGRTQTAGSEE